MKNGGPAFPGQHIERIDTPVPGLPGSGEEQLVWHGGMNLRDYFAGQALAGAIGSAMFEVLTIPQHARAAYSMADAMLKAREGGE